MNLSEWYAMFGICFEFPKSMIHSSLNSSVGMILIVNAYVHMHDMHMRFGRALLS